MGAACYPYIIRLFCGKNEKSKEEVPEHRGISLFTPLSFRRGVGGEANPLHSFGSAARCRSGTGGARAKCDNERYCEVAGKAGFFVTR